VNRLFVALRPPPEIRAQLAATMDGVAHARWQDDDQLHLTLRFIGEVERPLAEDIAAALAQVHAEAPVVALAGVGRFERRGATTALWAGLSPHPALAALHRKVDQACIRAGLAGRRAPTRSAGSPRTRGSPARRSRCRIWSCTKAC